MDISNLTTIGLLILFLIAVILNRSITLWIRKDGIYFSLGRHPQDNEEETNTDRLTQSHATSDEKS